MENPTVCKYLSLDADGTVRGVSYTWEDYTDRNGDGEAELDGFLERSRDHGFALVELPGFPVGPGLPGNVSSDALRVFRADSDLCGSIYFALAILPTRHYWDRTAGEWTAADR